MSNERMIPLICTQCGGHIKITKSDYDENFGTFKHKAVYMGKDYLACISCGTEFKSNAQFEIYLESTEINQTAIGNNIAQSVVNNKMTAFDQSGQNVARQTNISGNIRTNGGDFVGRDKIVVGDLVRGRVKNVIVAGDIADSVVVSGNGNVVGYNNRIMEIDEAGRVWINGTRVK